MANGKITIGTYEPYPLTQHGKITIGYYGINVVMKGLLTIGGYLPVAAFSATPLSGLRPLEVVFTDLSTHAPSSWLWDFGDGETSTEQNPTHIFNDAGTYTVSLTATNSVGSDTVIQTDYISVIFSIKELTGLLYQENIGIIPGRYYKLSFTSSNITASAPMASVIVRQGSQTIDTFTLANVGSRTIYFTANNSGDIISFDPNQYITGMVLDDISLRKRYYAAIADDRPVKEFLTGETDDGKAIHFRADTHPIQLQEDFELFSFPKTIINKVQRGTAVKCHIAVDDGDFYELKGKVIKGVSVLDVHADTVDGLEQVPARELRISWRDSSKQRCCLVHATLNYIPTTMDIIE